MLGLLRRQTQPDHERLSDEIIGYVLARQVPPSALVAAAQEAKKKAVAAAQGAVHVLQRPAPWVPVPAAQPVEEVRLPDEAKAPAANGPASLPAAEWRARELKRIAAVRAYVAEGGLTPATRTRLQDYAVELHGLAHLHGYGLVAKVACLLGGVLEGENGSVFFTVETHLTCARALLRSDVRDSEDPVGQAMFEELFELASATPPASAQGD